MNAQKQIGKFHATLLENLPNMTSDVIQGWIENPKALQKYLKGLAPDTAPAGPKSPIFHLADKIERDTTGWKCVKPVRVREDSFGLRLWKVLQGNERKLPTEDLLERGRLHCANAGLIHLEALLRDQEKIPADCRSFSIVSAETWQNPGGHNGFWYICYDGQEWNLFFYYLALVTDQKLYFAIVNP